MADPIPSADPGAAYRAHQDAIDAAVERVVQSGRYVLGPEVESFEEVFASYIGVSEAAGVGSGTDALQIALRASGVGAGDEVVVPAFGSVATIAAVELAGAIPVLADIDDTFCIHPHSVANVLTSRTRAVVAVHLYGHPADMDALLDITKRQGIALVEDAAQAHGARYKGKRVGALGDAAAFSFYPTKNLGALGDAGAVLCDDEHFGERVKRIRQYGWSTRQISATKGLNSRLDAIQAAVLRVRLPYLDDENRRRRQIAAMYNEGLGETGLILPRASADAEHVYHQYTVRFPKRDRLRSCLADAGVGAAVLYPSPVHRQPAYADVRTPSNGLPESEKAASEILCLPVYPYLSDASVDRIISTLCSCLR